MSEHPPFREIPIAAKPVEKISAVAAGPSDAGAFTSVSQSPGDEMAVLEPPESPAAPEPVPTFDPAPLAPALPIAGWPPVAAYPAVVPPQGWVLASPPTTISAAAVAALVLAISAWVFCPLILAIVALIFASQAKKGIDRSGGAKQGYGLVAAARLLSWINIGVWVAIIVLAIGVMFALLIAGAYPGQQLPTISL